MTKLSLAQDFPDPGNAADWMALVEKALKGADYEKTLHWRSLEGIELKPLYTAGDETPAGGLPGAAPFTRGLRAEPGQPAWDIRQLHAHPDPLVANDAILADLTGGATSVTLRIAAPGQAGIELPDMAALEQLLDGVFLDFADTSLQAGCLAAPAGRALQAIWTKKDISPGKASASFNLDPLGTLARAGALPVSMEQAMTELAQFVEQTGAAWPKASSILVDTTPYHDGGAGEALELTCLCATMVAYLRALEGAGIEPETAIAQMAFALAADTDQFMSIAKLRAARMLIARIAEASGAEKSLPRVRLHATTSARMMAASGPWVNLLRTTMACSAAAMGGADSITVLPFTWALGLPDAFARRVARNIQLILQEEASLGAVIDPAGGSWYVESLTGELAATAWTLFQGIEREGGMARALAKGHVQAMIAKTAEARSREVATSGAELTGVNAYPHIDRAPDTEMPHPVPDDIEDPAITVEPVPLRAPSAPFDALRRAADAHFDQTGKRPAVFIACLGAVADFSARAAYARNAFAAAGIETIGDSSVSDPEAAAKAFTGSHAKLACICSSDEVYAGMAAETATALRKAGARRIYLAGRPGDLRSTLRDAGVGSFIHKGCDMLELLENAHDVLGISKV